MKLRDFGFLSFTAPNMFDYVLLVESQFIQEL